MPKQAFRDTNTFRTGKRKQTLAQIVQVIEEHQAAGIRRMTSRQLYYRLVAANIIPNNARSYQNLTTLLTDARYAGFIDWNFIVDLGREPLIPTQYEDINELADAAVASLRYDRWEGQGRYVEVWVEKQALQSVLEPIGDELHVPIVVNKGYTSASSMYRSAVRLSQQKQAGRKTFVIYCGDLDPSGDDMVRDIGDRLREFGVVPTITKLALNLDQVREYECPVNPAKSTDSRFQGYADKFMSDPDYAAICDAQGVDPNEVHSWELDAIPVAELDRLVREAVKKHIVHPELVEEIKEKEQADKRAMRKAAEAIARGEFSADEDDDE